MSTQIKYAYRRHNTWIYRRTYPVQLQEILGSSLKRSLHTADAKVAAKRVAELNTTFAAIIKEAEEQLTNKTAPAHIPIAVPRYQRARLLGEEQVQDVAALYLAEASDRLRPGSYKSVRFALELLTSHVGDRKLGDLNDILGKEVLGYVARLSPNIRKYGQAQGASLAELAAMSEEYEEVSLTAQTQRRIWRQLQQFLDWCVLSGRLETHPWYGLLVRDKPEVRSHRVLTDEQVSLLLNANDRVLHSALLFCLLTGMRSGEMCGLLAEDVSTKGNLGRFVQIRPNHLRQLKSKAAEREVPLHPVLEQLLDQRLPSKGRLFPSLSVDRVVKRYAYLRSLHKELHGTVFHSTRKWFITQCERTGVPEHFTASLVGHQSAPSENKLTYGLYSAGISDTQKREIIDQVRLPQEVML